MRCGPVTDVRNFRSDDRDRILAEIYEMTEQHFAVARHLLDDAALGLLHDGRDRRRPHPPRLLALARPGASRATSPASLRRRDPQLLPVPRRRDRRAAGGSSTTTRPCSSSPTTARRRWRARSASTSGSCRRATSSSATARDAHGVPGRRRRLEPDARVGRGRLLLPPLPERRGPRARGHRARGGVRAAARRADRAAGGARRARRPDRHPRAPSGGPLGRAPRHPARPRRLLRRPRLAQQRQPRPRPPLHLRQRHGARRRQPRPHGLCIVNGAGVPSARRDDLVIFDVAPTILRLAGLTDEGGIGEATRGAR